MVLLGLNTFTHQTILMKKMIRESEAKAKTEKLNIWSEENAVNTSLTSAKNIKTAKHTATTKKSITHYSSKKSKNLQELKLKRIF